jgi:hypothetical protein
MTDIIENINENQNDMCLVCWSLNSNIILCSKCKYVYCQECATKINNFCCICKRTKNLSNNYFNYYNFDFEVDIDSVNDEYDLNNRNFFNIIINLIFFTVVFLGLFTLFLISGYIVIMFFYNIFNNHIQMICWYEDF